jgi:hypothetical protein
LPLGISLDKDVVPVFWPNITNQIPILPVHPGCLSWDT